MSLFGISVKSWVLFVMILNTIRAEGNIYNTSSFNGVTPLSHSTYLDANDNYFIQWDFDELNITFEVHVKTIGYVGLGFSPNGGMPGSDLIIGWVDDTTGQPRLTDRFAEFRAEPQIDKIQNYELLHGFQNGTHTVLRFRRPLILCDQDDRAIREETIRVIWSYSATDPSNDGRALYHGTNRGTKSIYLLNPVRQTSLPPDDSMINVDFFNLAIEPMIEPGHESFVHHILIYGCYKNVSETSYSTEHECYSANMPKDWFECDGVMFSWAVGGETFTFPENAGYPLGHSGDPTMILMETHYDNPQLRPGLVDSSGIRLQLTPKLRANDAGIFQMGSFISNTLVIPPFEEDFQTNGYCIPECLSEAMTDTQVDHVTLFAGYLHAHIAGTAIKLRHFRYGIELDPIAEDLNYDFNFQETRTLKKEVLLKRGDYTMTECHYRTMDRSNLTLGGFATTDEMCLAFVMYYPKIPVSVCSTSLRRSYFGKYLGLETSDFGGIKAPSEHAGKDIMKVADSLIDWRNKTIRDALQYITMITNETAFLGACYDGGRYGPGHYSPTRVPQTIYERPAHYGEACHVSGAFIRFPQLYLINSVLFLSYFLIHY